MIGAGVVGLTTAVCLAESGLAVTIQAGELPRQTTSAERSLIRHAPVSLQTSVSM